MSRVCVCGCGKRAGLVRHHAIYRQELRRAARSEGKEGWSKRFHALNTDADNLVDIHALCHMDHHNRVRVLALRDLPDSVFSFACRVLGPGPAFNYLTRHYAGTDVRLSRLVEGEHDERSAA